MKKRNEYAVYRGDVLVTIGTARECARAMGWKNDKTVRDYASPSVKAKRKTSRGIFVERIREGEDNEIQN